jgi:transposase
MKKIQEYILKGKDVFIGLEDSAKTWKLCARSGRKVINETTMPATYQNLHNYLCNKFPACTIRIMYEAGFRGFELHDSIVADGWQCIVTPPHTVTEEKCNLKKNDRNDCRRLAKNNENGDFKSCHVPDRQQREDRQVIRLYGQIQKDIIRTRCRIRRTLEYHGLDRHLPSGEWKEANYRAAEALIKTRVTSASLKFVLSQLFDMLDCLRKKRCDVLKQLKTIAIEDRYSRNIKIVQSAPGIGFLTAIRLILEWGQMSRFKRNEEFASFLGLVPSDYSTGEQDHKGHITRQGNSQVRASLIESAWVAIRYDPVLLEKYRTVLSHCGSGKKAIVAVARKLAMRLRAMLINGEMYEIGLVKCEKV